MPASTFCSFANRVKPSWWASAGRVAPNPPRSTKRWEWSTSIRGACNEGPCMPFREAVREPDAGDPQVRFDERRWETELRPRLRHRQSRRKPQAIATPSTYVHRARRRLYPLLAPEDIV